MSQLFVGVMSGTSLDGVDAVLCDFAGVRPITLGFECSPFPAALRSELLALTSPGNNELDRAGVAANQLAHLYAATVNRLLAGTHTSPQQVRAIGCHGQTIRHRPEMGFSLQLQNPALLAELTGVTVVADFRNRDLAAGGQGAPLVPAFHNGLFRDPQRCRTIVNIGGISNISVLNRNQPVFGFDCGPGNVLMDAWIQMHLNEPFDDSGRWASMGRVLPAFLDGLLTEPYFRRPPPKSTGRELFTLSWLRSFINKSYSPVDVQATLLELAVQTITHDVVKYCPRCQELFICGGGAQNVTLMTRLSALLPDMAVSSTETLGIPAMQVEALAFAWLAQQTIENKPLDLTAVTGAKHPTILGAIYPA